jgi:extracellular elastinolytic metalloproteinase
MYWNLVDKLGFNDDLYSADTTKGNTLALRIVMDALKLMPCEPDFISGRDFILQAEAKIPGGDHHCEIWAAFGKRGLGPDAGTYTITVENVPKTTYKEHFGIPSGCDGKI